MNIRQAKDGGLMIQARPGTDESAITPGNATSYVCATLFPDAFPEGDNKSAHRDS